MRRLTEHRLKALVVGASAFALSAYATHVLADAGAPAAVPSADPISGFVRILRDGGPLAVAVIAGWWALRKDREKNDLEVRSQAQMKAMYDEVVALVKAQTAAMERMEGTIRAFKDAINALTGRERRGRKIEEEDG